MIADKKYLDPIGMSELINKIQADMHKKQNVMQYGVMPSVLENIGRVVQYIGPTNNDYVKGYFYIATATRWANVNVTPEVVICKDGLPAWEDANPGLIYYVPSTGESYCRNNDESVKGWYKFSAGRMFHFVTELPDLETMDSDLIYMLVNEDNFGVSVTGYIKVEDELYTIGKRTTLRSSRYVNGKYVENEEVPVDELTLMAVQDSEIESLFIKGGPVEPEEEAEQ